MLAPAKWRSCRVTCRKVPRHKCRVSLRRSPRENSFDHGFRVMAVYHEMKRIAWEYRVCLPLDRNDIGGPDGSREAVNRDVTRCAMPVR
jgi:hypothetical protein